MASIYDRGVEIPVQRSRTVGVQDNIGAAGMLVTFLEYGKEVRFYENPSWRSMQRLLRTVRKRARDRRGSVSLRSDGWGYTDWGVELYGEGVILN